MAPVRRNPNTPLPPDMPERMKKIQIPYKTIVISGLVARNSGRNAGDYADIEFVYNVEPNVDIEDLRYWFRSRNIRTAPVKVFDGGRKTQWFMGEDSERGGEAPDTIYNRVGISKKLEKDMKDIEWHTPADKARKK